MIVNKDTLLKDILKKYPSLKEHLISLNDKYKLLNSSLAKVLMNNASLKMVAKKGGMDIDHLISNINQYIKEAE